METATLILISLVALKAIIIGSDFNIYKWIKYGKSYSKKYEEWRTKLKIVQFRGIQDIPVCKYYGELVLGYNIRYVFRFVFRFDDSSLIKLKSDEIEKHIFP